LDAPETPLEYSFCAYAILNPEMLIVEDAEHDPTFATHPAVTEENGIRFYAGVPLINPEGYALGTICVADRVPRQLEPEQYRALEALSRQVLTQLELRRKLRDLRKAIKERDLAEAEKAVKDAEIQRDLQFAHQFQQSLLPKGSDYPAVRSAPPVPLRLNFHHVYQPALSLGGDFFDVIKISEHSAGVFIADVMGHGARSALITAILRTLFQDLAPQIEDPGELLMRMNRRFYSIVQGSSQFLFASAFYMVVNTEKAMVRYASAGHPAPIAINRGCRSIAHLEGTLCSGPALGVAEDGIYQSSGRDLEEGDVFLLFTDGLLEAPNAEGEEFGDFKLYATLNQHCENSGGELVNTLLREVTAFSGVSLPDDLCLVAVEVSSGTEA
jgi:sigma-B regulation protein RsbU (phosphoserine phosphatase)